MSRKRHKPKPARNQAVPQEIVAEGSGPHEAELADDGTLAVRVVEIAEASEPGDEASIEVSAESASEAAPDVPVELEVVEAADGAGSAEAAPVDEATGELDDAAVLDDGVGAALPTSAASMDAVQLRHLVEALVFASDKPMTLLRLRQLTRVADTRRLEEALAELARDYEHRGLILQQVSGGFQFRTQTRYSTWVQQLIAGRPVRLSRAQLETLAIVAYRQPITRPEIDEIRGVDSSATLKLLLDRALIRILGKKEEVGRPMLYGTTKEFLDFFSLGDLRELPTLREYSELTAESRRVVSDRLGVEVEDESIEARGEVGSGEGDAPADALGHVFDPESDVEAAPGEFLAHDVGDDGSNRIVEAAFDLDAVVDPVSEDVVEARITWEPDEPAERTLASIAERRLSSLAAADSEAGAAVADEVAEAAVDVEQMAEALASLDPDRVVPVIEPASDDADVSAEAGPGAGLGQLAHEPARDHDDPVDPASD